MLTINRGKNVCIYHLLDSCKFGRPKCVYSHSKDALPKRGWWNSPEKTAKVKAVLEVAETNAREARLQESQKKGHLKDPRSQTKPPKSAGLKEPKDVAAEDPSKVHKTDTKTSESNGDAVPKGKTSKRYFGKKPAQKKASDNVKPETVAAAAN